MKITSDLTLPDIALIIAHPLDINLFLSLMPKPKRKHPVCLAKFHLFPTFTVIGPCLGRPQMLLILEHLFAWGARIFFFWGWCGGINSNLNTGDIVLPTGVQDKKGIFFPAHTDLLKILHQTLSLSFLTGTVISVDNPYALNQKEVEALRKDDILAIDMETQALFSWSAEHKTKAAAILTVSDLLTQTEWEPGFFLSGFKHKRQQIARELKRILTFYKFK